MSVFWILCLVAAVITTAAELQFQIETDVHAFRRDFRGILRKVYAERSYESVLLLRRQAADCIDEELQKGLMAPTLCLDEQQSIYWKGNYSSELLAIMCLSDIEEAATLERLADNLQHMRDSRVIVIVNAIYGRSSPETYLETFFKQCEFLKLINVNVLHRDFYAAQLYHSFTQFPTFALERRRYLSYRGADSFFPNRLLNLHQKVVVTLPDQIEPRTMLYTDALGSQQMSGYIGKFMRTFAAQYNCTLRFPYNMSDDQVIYLAEVRQAARNGSVDVGASLSTPGRFYNIHEYTYPIEIAEWLTMVPLELAVPKQQLISMIFSVPMLLSIFLQFGLLSTCMTGARHGEAASAVDVLLDTMRGLLSQAFPMTLYPKISAKVIFFLIFLTGLVNSTTYSANLVKFLTAPPSRKPIGSYDDLVAQNLKIMLAEQEVFNVIFFMGDDFWRRYRSVFHIVENYGEFQRLRHTMNTQFAYSITTSSWPVVAEEQNYFAHKLFRLSEELYITKHLLFGLPVHANSIYKEPLNRFIFRTHEAGLFVHWFSTTFWDMVALKRLSLQDLSDERGFSAWQVGDFYWIWTLYCVAIGLCVVVFLIEVSCIRKFWTHTSI